MLKQFQDFGLTMHIRIGADVMLAREKAPYVASGKSYQGVLELDLERDLVRCHECGEWHPHLAPHIWQRHGMTARAYKAKHGINQNSALCNERIRQALVRHAASPQSMEAAYRGIDKMNGSHGMKPSERMPRPRGPHLESRNRKGLCREQILVRLRQMAEKLGRTPKSAELVEAGIHPRTVEYMFSLKMAEVIRLAGLRPRNVKRTQYTAVGLVERMRNFYVRYGKLPSKSDYRRGLIPSSDIYSTVFGGMANAYFAAGLELVAEKERQQRLSNCFAHQPHYSDSDLRNLLRSFMVERLRRPTLKDFGGPGLAPSEKTFRRRLGSLGPIYESIELELRKTA